MGACLAISLPLGLPLLGASLIAAGLALWYHFSQGARSSTDAALTALGIYLDNEYPTDTADVVLVATLAGLASIAGLTLMLAAGRSALSGVMHRKGLIPIKPSLLYLCFAWPTLLVNWAAAAWASVLLAVYGACWGAAFALDKGCDAAVGSDLDTKWQLVRDVYGEVQDLISQYDAVRSTLSVGVTTVLDPFVTPVRSAIKQTGTCPRYCLDMSTFGAVFQPPAGTPNAPSMCMCDLTRLTAAQPYAEDVWREQLPLALLGIGLLWLGTTLLTVILSAHLARTLYQRRHAIEEEAIAGRIGTGLASPSTRWNGSGAPAHVNNNATGRGSGSGHTPGGMPSMVNNPLADASASAAGGLYGSSNGNGLSGAGVTGVNGGVPATPSAPPPPPASEPWQVGQARASRDRGGAGTPGSPFTGQAASPPSGSLYSPFKASSGGDDGLPRQQSIGGDVPPTPSSWSRTKSATKSALRSKPSLRFTSSMELSSAQLLNTEQSLGDVIVEEDHNEHGDDDDEEEDEPLVVGGLAAAIRRQASNRVGVGIGRASKSSHNGNSGPGSGASTGDGAGRTSQSGNSNASGSAHGGVMGAAPRTIQNGTPRVRMSDNGMGSGGIGSCVVSPGSSAGGRSVSLNGGIGSGRAGSATSNGTAAHSTPRYLAGRPKALLLPDS